MYHRSNVVKPKIYRRHIFNIGPDALKPINDWLISPPILTVIQEFLDAWKTAKISSLKSNKTGRRVDLKLRLGGVSIPIHLLPANNDSDFSYQFIEAAALGYVRLRKGKNAVGDDVSIWLFMYEHLRNDTTEYINDFVAQEYFARRCYQHHRGESYEKIVKEIDNFISSNKLNSTFANYQVGLTKGKIRELAENAFAHGASLDELIEILKEAMVKQVLSA